MKVSQGSKTLLYPTPVLVVGTYDSEGKPNAAIAAWGGICCSGPPALQVSFRKATYTHGNIIRSGAFTVSVPSECHVQQADYFGMASGRDVDKFSVTGLTPVHATFVEAPYIDEFPLVLECKLIHTLEIGLHTLFVGEIVDVKVDESALGDSGKATITKVRPLIFAPDDGAYFGVGDYIAPAFSVGKALGR